MLLLVASLVAFGVAHLLPAIPRAKNAVMARLGKAYGPAYGLLSLLLLVAAIAAFRQAEANPIYAVPAWGRYANFALTLLAFICLGIFIFRGTWRNRLKYPMAIGIWLWGAGHLLANGDGRTTVFFAGLMVIAFLHFFLASRLLVWTAQEERAGHDLLSVLFGTALYGVMTQLHSVIAGVPVIDLSGLVP